MAKILFASPYIEEKRPKDHPAYPNFRSTQHFVDTLRFVGYEVVTVSEPECFKEMYAEGNFDLVIAMSFDGDWLSEAFNEAKPTPKVQHFCTITGHSSPYIEQQPMEKITPGRLVKFVSFLVD